MADRSVTVGGLLDYLCPQFDLQQVPRWPPDAFGLAAVVLQRSGTYDSVVSRWPPQGLNGGRWLRFVNALGDAWWQAWINGPEAPLPRAITKRWDTVQANRDVSLIDLRTKTHVVHALLEICAAADEACYGIGIPGTPTQNAFDNFALEHLAASSRNGSTLCDLLHPSRVIVLPKLHTPRNGVSLRSLSHNICACEPGEIRPVWTPVASSPDQTSLNLLVIPWPYHVMPSQFRPADEPCAIDLRTMPEKFGFFEYTPPARSDDQIAKMVREFVRLLGRATSLVGHIHGVVLPELSLTQKEFDRLSTVTIGTIRPLFTRSEA